MVIDGMDVTADEDAAVPDHAAELLERVARDRAAFAQLYDLLASRVFGLILRVLVNRSHAEEVLQEIFSRSGNPLRSSLRTRVREGVGHDDRASQGRRPRAVCAVERRPRRAGGSARTFRAGGCRRAGGAAHRKPSGVTSARNPARTPARSADLAYFGGYSQSEISAMTGTALGTIKTRMRDGLSRLRQEMGVTDGR
jgi:RNA polymerase sigma-70 factor (ECF subfamily)